MKALTKVNSLQMKLQEIAENKQVVNNLSPVELKLLQAASRKMIKDYSEKETCEYIGTLFNYISYDLGILTPKSNDERAYICTRIAEMLKAYYRQMTLHDVKLAFELFSAGRLDSYLQKDSAGKAKKEHYQRFNVDFVLRVMNAYSFMQNEAIAKSLRMIPEEKKEISEEEKAFYNNRIKERVKEIFLKYKESGKLEARFNEANMIFQYLKAKKMLNDITPTEEEKKAAYKNYMKREKLGLISRYTAYNVKLRGLEAKEIQPMVEEYARARVIVNAFDKCINDCVEL